MSNEEAITHGWHLDKRVSISHIITTLTVSAAVMVWIFTLDARVKVNEVRIDAMGIQDNVLRSELGKMGDSIIDKLDRMDMKQYEHIQLHINEAGRKAADKGKER